MSKLSRAEQGEQTRKKFVDAILIMLDQGDVNKLNIRDLCASIGVSPRTFYLYFKSKEDAIMKCYSYMFGEKFRKFIANENVPEDPYVKLVSLFRMLFRMYKVEEDLTRNIIIGMLHTYNDNFYSNNGRMFESIYRLFGLCQEEGYFSKKYDCEKATWDIITAHRGILVDALMRFDMVDLEERGVKEMKMLFESFTDEGYEFYHKNEEE